MHNKLEKSWANVLKKDLESDYFKEIKSKIKEEYATQIVYPPFLFIFNALNLTPFDQVKVVIIGQDPYHGPNQAHGLSFSVQNGINPPPSLLNIYKEIESDLNIKMNKQNGNLTSWAKQGVLLLNAVLTVRHKSPGSHRKIGWEQFTDSVIKKISDEKKGIVFLLWGKYAGEKAVLINSSKHLILQTPHPSPYSASSGFFGCKHFSKTNDYLISKGLEPIDWAS